MFVILLSRSVLGDLCKPVYRDRMSLLHSLIVKEYFAPGSNLRTKQETPLDLYSFPNIMDHKHAVVLRQQTISEEEQKSWVHFSAENFGVLTKAVEFRKRPAKKKAARTRFSAEPINRRQSRL